MIEIIKDSENVEKSPFQEEIVLENYFPCGSRVEVLSDMKQAVQDGVALMVLTGEEGTGKTMLCRVLEHEAPCHTVFFPRTVDSFEEVVRTIAESLGVKKEIDIGDIDQSLQHIIDSLLNRSAGLLVIFDEAENIFLATLERIRKMLDHINGAGAYMHVLLSGRETLLENCDQVSLCNFQNSDERHFELSPLSEAETAAYLQYCAARLPGIDAAKVFTDEVISNIYALAHGNFRMINILGEETVTPRSDETSFMVLLEGVEEDVDIESEPSRMKKYPQLAGKITPYLPWIGGALCCLLLLVFLFRSGEDAIEVGKDINQAPKIDQVEKVVEKVTTTQEMSDNLSEQKELAALAPVEELQPPVEEEAAVAGPEENAPGQENAAVPQSMEKSPEPIIHQDQDVAEHVAPETTTTTETVAPAGSVDSTAVTEPEEKEVVAAVQENLFPEAATEEIKDIALLRPGKQVKKKTAASPAQQLRSATSQPLKKAAPKGVASTPSTRSFAADQLYNARLSAGVGWQSIEKKKMFTVQVMALTSKNAEQNLKKILAQVNYRQEAGNFYILKKKTAPAGIFVFYGEYPSMARAHLAQNSLPQFLRDHKPYALSIKKATAKVGK